MDLRCKVCESPSLRLSRLRAIDLPFLLVLHRAVRCKECFRRQYIPLLAARGLQSRLKGRISQV